MNRFPSRLTIIAVSGMVAVASMILQAATAPAWWVTRGTINTNLPPNDFAAVNQGQLKWMAVNAAMELESQLPGGAGSNVWALISSFTDSNNFRPVNLGQLKYVAQPFWSNLIAVGYATNYPWSGQANDYALANIGQMKNVFNCDAATWMTLDTDQDGTPNWWMFQNFGHVTAQTNDLSRADDDPDGDGSTNYAEYLAGTDPHNANSMPADNPVKLMLEEMNYSRMNLRRALIGLAPISWMFATNNEVRIAQMRGSFEEIIPHEVPSTLADVLNCVSNYTGNTSGYWLQGSLSDQVYELSCIFALSTWIASPASITYEGVTNQWYNDFEFEGQRFGYWPVTAQEGAYPSQWPTNWPISTFIEFEQERVNDPRSPYPFPAYIDDSLSVNDPDSPYPWWVCYGYQSVDVTSDWLPNADNEIYAWDTFFDQFYCSDFHIRHFLTVPNLTLRFVAKTNEINHGFDPTEAEPWTSVGVGSTNQIVQLSVLEDGNVPYVSNIVLFVSAEDAAKIDVSPNSGFTNGLNDLTITGKLPTSNAVIEVRVQGMTNAIAALHVMVLPWITNSIGIYRIVDTNSSLTAPVGGPNATNIINELNSVYSQACVRFVLTNTNTADSSTHFGYDSMSLRIPDRLPHSGAMEYGEEPEDLDNDNLWSGQGRVFLLREGNIGNVGGYTRDIGMKWCVVFTHNTNPRTSLAIAHEVGHQLNLSTRGNPSNKYHDEVAAPSGTGALMRRGLNVPAPNPEGRWMRWQDWQQANSNAYDRVY